ncbi:acyl-CoA dehydrogenase family protein [Novosphingobium colocasiae]|uniref:Acyl-CoA dehydrogenase n=1 Tax=Novosphingobium colocasiae TaxID=1256513 RepID=A0A918UIQ5_9SPHN|nr:acyl-CoA dehydrogenase family protein [Novosphingobium colocasiae]GGZ13234.1 acyl-CoA dehydrogenase [Novosphingobium colocasiae]
MDLAFTPEQQMIADVIDAFAREVLLPRYAHWDRTGNLPEEQFARMGEIGLLGLRVPEAFGGQDVDAVTAGLAIEAAARGDFNCCYAILIACFAGEILGRHGDDAVKAEWLPGMASGEKIICTCLTEPQGGSDAAGIRTRAVRQGDDYVISGEKASITLVMAGHAGIVFAKTDPAAGAKGVTAFLVPFDLPGVSRAPYADLGSRGIARGSLFFDEVRIPARYRIGAEGAAFSKVMHTFDYTRALIGLMCLGAAQQSLAETVEYLKSRQSFGQPLPRYQGVSFPVAEWAAKIEMARWLCLRTLWLRDQNLPHTAEAAMCKMQCPDIAVGAIHECLLLHGHYGYTQDFPHEQRLRDVIGQQIADGTTQIQKLIVARELFGRDFV